MEIHLVLEHGPSEGPDSGEDEVELVEILVAVWRSVFWNEETLQEVTQHLHQTLLRNRDDLLKSGSRTESSSVISNFNTSQKHKFASIYTSGFKKEFCLQH